MSTKAKLPSLMQGVVLTGHGGLEMLSFRQDLPLPATGPGDVLVKIEAAAVNNTDINTRLAWYSRKDADAEDASWSGSPLCFPRIQGADGCGHIVAVGDGISSERIGERVLIEPCLTQLNGKSIDPFGYFGSECDGAFAEYAAVPAIHAHTISSELSAVELASFPCSYSTAENMLTKAQIAEGEHVLVTGASGGVGSAAVQLAKARGAIVTALTSPGKIDRLLEIGADTALNRDVNLIDKFGENYFDAVIDLVAGDKWPSLLKVLRSGGRYAVAGAIGGAQVSLDVRDLYLKDLSFFGCTKLGNGVFSNLVRHIEAGLIKPLVAETFPLKAIKKAQEAFVQKSHIGKIVLTHISQ